MSVTTTKMQQVLSVLMVCVLQHCIAQTQGGGTHKNTLFLFPFFFSFTLVKLQSRDQRLFTFLYFNHRFRNEELVTITISNV